MRSVLKMPKVGDAANEVLVVGISVKPGAMVAAGDTLFTVETDKATIDVPSPAAGRVVEILLKLDDELPTGAPTVVLEV
jgi:pyruvate/2-oxoglutarate dehydrogenase complex dihydrolipoamide acyltransferase (E2) component